MTVKEQLESILCSPDGEFVFEKWWSEGDKKVLREVFSKLEEMEKDTERLDFLQSLNDKEIYTGKCELRMSTTGRGWRLHETETFSGKACRLVRTAIDNFMKGE